jgi:hypothetical protein
MRATGQRGRRKTAPQETETQAVPLAASVPATAPPEMPVIEAAPVAETQRRPAWADSPLDYMLRVMRDHTVESQRRDEMAKLALPYLHPKPTAIEHTGRDGGPAEISAMSETEIARRIAFMLTRAARLDPEKH